MNFHARAHPDDVECIEFDTIQAHVAMLHQLAGATWDDGKLVLFAVGEDPRTGRKISPRVEHFDIGDVDGMVTAAESWAQIPHLNVYAPWAIFRRDLPPGQKGSAKEVVSVLALVADLDNDKDQGGTLPLEPPYVIESSAGNFQAVYPLARALSVQEAKPIAQALADATGCDPRTKDVGGVWRIPGLPNWPNKKKVGRGRSPEPQPVRVEKSWTGELIEPGVLQATFGSHDRPNTDTNDYRRGGDSGDTVNQLLDRCGPELRELITSTAGSDEDRSATAFSAMWKLMMRGFTDSEIERLFEAHPEGIGERYDEGKDLKGDIRRAREKWVARRGSATDVFPDIVSPSVDITRTNSDGPLPLFPPLPPSEPYPVKALGPLLSRAARAIASKVQVPDAIAAQSVLAAAALAAQVHADVLLPFGQKRPLSLYCVTVAGSGDRKSTADNEALRPVREREETLRAFHDEDMKAYRVSSAAWHAEKKRIEGDRKIDYAERKQRIADLGPEPQHPLRPYLTVSNLTIEGLLKTWVHAPAALGVFTAEGGQFTSGHGMAEDRRLETAGIYSELWDATPIKRLRALDGATVLYGRRLTLHLMIQPDAATTFLSDARLQGQGLLARILVAAPESIAGTRLYREPTTDDEATIKVYSRRIREILGAPWPLLDGTANELSPRVLRLSAKGTAKWRQFADWIEERSGRGGDLSPIQPLAAKAAEHAARMAGVLTIIEDLGSTEISGDAMHDAIILARWYVKEALRLHHGMRADPGLLRADGLLAWLHGREEPEIGFRDIIQRGPAAVRTKSPADHAVSVLLNHGWLVEIKGRPRRFRIVKDGSGA